MYWRNVGILQQKGDFSKYTTYHLNHIIYILESIQYTYMQNTYIIVFFLHESFIKNAGRRCQLKLKFVKT